MKGPALAFALAYSGRTSLPSPGDAGLISDPFLSLLGEVMVTVAVPPAGMRKSAFASAAPGCGLSPGAMTSCSTSGIAFSL